jgi:ArsR family transcriptional regulator, lead/cadmium/zinc/bismuth-responsive transcriptional repressor
MTNRTSSALEEITAIRVAELFRAFSDTSRVRILYAIIGQELSVHAVAEWVGISVSSVSHHLRTLRQMRLVSSRRLGKEVYYRVGDEHIIALLQQGVKHVQDE